eukprot:TRINITY_DN23555_c0_g1_i1.p1 TRINITY_DN23555_c0_g1~~TRINITY_DN23555_c0_g1_i1.p1  ORF type:complete len:310 (+),score=45.69 TRINITY_DN23555_c0_g1_i1:75-932(+)
MWYLAMNNSADIRTLAICGTKAALVAACWHFYPVIPTPCLVVVLFIQFVSAFCVATMVHNAMHCDVFSNKFVEFVWRVLLAGTFGFPVEGYRPTHNANHHVFTQHEQDHLHTSQMEYRWHWLNLLMFFPKVYPGIAKLENAYLKKEAGKLSWNFFCFVSQAVAAHGVTVTLMLLDWRRAILLWFLPNILGVDGIVTMNMLQHDGCETVKLGEHRGEKMNVNCARNFVGPVINYITCNNGYHTIHHMYSNTHWTEYPRLHQKLVVPRMDPQFDEKCTLAILKYHYS